MSDITWQEILFASIVPSVVSGATVALLTVPIALGRFRSERLWERKLQAYADVLVALSHVRRYSREALDRLDTERTLSSDALTGLAARASEGREDIRRAAAIGALILEPTGAARLEQLESDLDDPHYNLDLHEEIEADLKMAQQAIKEIRDIAKKSAQLSRWRLGRGTG